MTYGAGLITRDTPLYRVTVILNPVASGGKGRKYYEKYCAPLLNLAGMKVGDWVMLKIMFVYSVFQGSFSRSP